MDEFMTLCKLIGAEPYITVNAGFGDAHSAAEEVEYMNGASSTRLGAERARNGHPEPYHVKYWDIGNEPYGAWQLGRTDLKYYVLKHNEFAKAMRKADPSITLLASGNMPEAMDLTGEMRAKDVDNMKAVEGTPEDWTGGLLEHSWGNFDGITQHWYARSGQRFDWRRRSSCRWMRPPMPAMTRWTRRRWSTRAIRPTSCTLKAAGVGAIRAALPGMLGKKNLPFHRRVRVLRRQLHARAGSEAGARLRHDLQRDAAAHGFPARCRRTPWASRRSTTRRRRPHLNTTGLMFKLYGDHFVPGSIPVALTGNSPQPAPQYPVGGDQPETNSGSPTYPLDMFAALTPDRKYLTLAVVNATDSEKSFALNLAGVKAAGTPEVWQLTGKDLQATDRVGQAPQVTIEKIAASGDGHTLSVAPISISIFEIPVGAGAK